MTLLPNEEKLLISNDEKVILTTHRIRMADSQWYNSFSIVIFLEDISSIETKYRGNILILIFSCLEILSGFYFSWQKYGYSPLNFNFIGGIFLLLFWWFSRKHIISISSNGGSTLNFQVDQMSKGQIENFIYNLQSAKTKRIDRLYKI
ncbi:MAG TPA: hypothetical protein VGP55_09265 [Chitinophagaceae bacterium]|nr:hypothetical protein [Chitinophagaceae bacterium]